MTEQLRPFLLVPVGFIAFGLLFAFVGLRGRKQAKAFRARAARAPGVVTEVRTRFVDTGGGVDTGGSLMYYPVVRFTLPDGRVVDTETPGAAPSPARQGAQVTVLYDPNSPTEAVLDSSWSDGTTGSGCITAFGIGFAVLGGLFLAGMLALMSIG